MTKFIVGDYYYYQKNRRFQYKCVKISSTVVRFQYKGDKEFTHLTSDAYNWTAVEKKKPRITYWK